jgi:hypothetical protein
MVKNASKLDGLASDIMDKENDLGHLNNTREALLENYIKSQKLALVLGKNNLMRSKHKVMS